MAIKAKTILTPAGRMTFIEASKVSGLPVTTLKNRVRDHWHADDLFCSKNPYRNISENGRKRVE